MGLRKLEADANKEGKMVECCQMDVRSFDFQSNYDVIVARTILDHLPESDSKILAARMANALTSNGLLFVTVFTLDDPGAQHGKDQTSECASHIKHYYKHNELMNSFPNLQLLLYQEAIELDILHGQQHYHGKANYIGRNP